LRSHLELVPFCLATLTYKEHRSAAK